MEKYSGNKAPFIYAIFADEDREEAMKVLEDMSSKNYKLTYEEKKWEDCLNRAALVMLFISPAILENEDVTKLVNFASEKNKNIISVFLKDTKLTPGLSMMLGQTQGIKKYVGSDEDFSDKLYGSPALAHMDLSEEQKGSSKKQSRGLIIGIVAVAVLAVAFFGAKAAGLFGSKIDSELFSKLGIENSYKNMAAVYAYGETIEDKYSPGGQLCWDEEGYEKLLYVDKDTRLPLGKIKDITDFALMEDLTELCLCGNEIEDIKPLEGNMNLKLLDLSLNNGIDITGISSLTNLETLNLANTWEEETHQPDFSELKNMPNLKTLYIASKEQWAVDQAGDLPCEIKYIDTAVSTYDELKKALADENAGEVYVNGDITIPEGETLTIGKNTFLHGASYGGTDGDDEEMQVIENNGTIYVEGQWEMGANRRINNGKIVIKEGGLYSGGMCDTINNGEFIVEKGGKVIVTRGHGFSVEDGKYQIDGQMDLVEGGGFVLSGGETVNNGYIRWRGFLSDNGPFVAPFRIDGGKFTNKGKITFAESTEVEQSQYSDKWEDKEISADEIDSHNIEMPGGDDED